jgi:hypothetical protein
MTLRTGYTYTRRSAQVGGGAGTGGRDTTVPVTLSLGLGGGLSATYTGSFRNGYRSDLTGYARSRNRAHTLSLSGSLQPPAGLRERFRNRITMTGRMNTSHRQECRVRLQTGEACVPIMDDGSRTVDLSMDTLVEDLVVGFRLSYSSRASAIGLRSGSSSFQVGLFASFNFTAGSIPGSFR